LGTAGPPVVLPAPRARVARVNTGPRCGSSETCQPAKSTVPDLPVERLSVPSEFSNSAAGIASASVPGEALAGAAARNAGTRVTARMRRIKTTKSEANQRRCTMLHLLSTADAGQLPGGARQRTSVGKITAIRIRIIEPARLYTTLYPRVKGLDAV